MDLSTLLAAPFVMPSSPKVLALLLNELARTEPDLKKINQLISNDPVLTMHLLQTANSGYFKLSGKINSVSESLAVLSLEHVRVMAVAATSNTSLKAIPGINQQQFWAYSLNVAKLARSLAGVARQNQQAAFTCGLIHAMGELVMHIDMPDEMAALDPKVPPLDLKRDHAETQAFGFCYAQVSAGFTQKWHFPQPIVDALEHQCAPFRDEVCEPLAGIVHLAAWRARAREAGLSANALTVTFPSEVGDLLGLDIDIVLQQDPIDWSSQLLRRKLS